MDPVCARCELGRRVEPPIRLTRVKPRDHDIPHERPTILIFSFRLVRRLGKVTIIRHRFVSVPEGNTSNGRDGRWEKTRIGD